MMAKNAVGSMKFLKVDKRTYVQLLYRFSKALQGV